MHGGRTDISDRRRAIGYWATTGIVAPQQQAAA
jgi:hypothetical protein